jgi:hypothetical protein
MMFARTKSPTFIDSLVVEFSNRNEEPVRLVLKDEMGSVCRSLETKVPGDGMSFRWGGFNDLPYGVYYIECISGTEEFRHRIVKRV